MAHVLENLDTSPLPENEKQLLRFVRKVNRNSHKITASDIAPLRTVGWTDEAIYYAITVCALFNFYNRWVDATGVHAMSDEGHRKRGKISAKSGYAPSR